MAGFFVDEGPDAAAGPASVAATATVAAVAPTSAPPAEVCPPSSGSRLHERMQPMLGQWLSKLHGLINVAVASKDEGAADEEQRTLVVSSVGRARPIGTLQLGCGCRWGVPRVFWHFANGETLQLGGTAPPADWHLCWIMADEPAVAVDVWDNKLLQAAAAADERLRAQGLEAYLQHGMEVLARDQVPAPLATVGLCMTTKNRLWQLRQALPLNLIHCWPYRKHVKIYLVNFGSIDGTLDWVMCHCRSAIDVGLLVLHEAPDMEYWHASIAKNTAHMLADEEILVNVDGDNLVGPNFPYDVSKRMLLDGKELLQYEEGDGTCGRICYFRKDFLEVRGYDEDAFPMGAQDTDLLDRLKEKLGPGRFLKVKNKVMCQAIPNSRDEKISNCQEAAWLKWTKMDLINRMMFYARRQAGLMARNVCEEHIGIPAYVASFPSDFDVAKPPLEEPSQFVFRPQVSAFTTP